jgi:beta-lactamase class A
MGAALTAPLPGPLLGEVTGLMDEVSGVVGLWVHDLRHRETYGLRAEESFRPASTIKLFVLRELFRQAEAGQVSLAEEVPVRAQDMVPGSGVLKDLGPGIWLRLADAATLMVTVSDNVAANLLIGRLGTGAINRWTHQAGYVDTRLSGKLFRDHRSASVTTPRDLGRLMLAIGRRRAVSQAASMAMLDILRREQSSEIVGRFPPPRWKVASKSGSLPGIRNDVAYVEGAGARYAVALMSRGCADSRFSVDNEATVCLARIARAVHDHASRS